MVRTSEMTFAILIFLLVPGRALSHSRITASSPRGPSSGRAVRSAAGGVDLSSPLRQTEGLSPIIEQHCGSDRRFSRPASKLCARLFKTICVSSFWPGSWLRT